MDDDLSSLILAIRIAKQAMAVVRQNAGIVVGPEPERDGLGTLRLA